ncbi:peptidylprolyl isomerase [Haloferula chungangensis]|uniref:peptidylprolyl isomerase n=1 Tax=Haloferula chungangensis TaxID=1048331 RepID=A0ABW2L0E3_9BACT
MKNVLIISSALVTAATADLIANVETDKGIILVKLEYQKAPQAVANFITLAQGTRSSIDPSTGAVRNAPYYVGEKFFRIVNESTFKIAQTGSGTGTNVGGPGYTFKDEFDETLTHEPYILSMANSGPNTNGSQIFFTGSVGASHLDNVHTVFGTVSDSSSQQVIDQIHAAGSDGSSILAVTFDRTDAAAQAFDEHAQNLPTVSVPEGELVVSRNQFCRFDLLSPATTGDILSASRSSGLTDWTALTSQHVGISPDPLETPAVDTLELDDASSTSAFYHLAIARHPDAVAPSDFKSRTVSFPVTGGTYTLEFDASGLGGTTTFTPSTGSPFGGAFTVLSDQVNTGAYHFSFAVDTPSINPRGLRIQAGAETATDSLVNCRLSLSYWNGANWIPYPQGTCTVTR